MKACILVSLYLRMATKLVMNKEALKKKNYQQQQ